MSTRFPRGALFDLDGTLLDSAPDMVAAVNVMRAERAASRRCHWPTCARTCRRAHAR